MLWTLTVVRYCDEILTMIVRTYTAAVGPGFLLVKDNAWLHVVRGGRHRQFLDDLGIDTIDRPSPFPDLNPIEHLLDVMYGTVQELIDA